MSEEQIHDLRLKLEIMEHDLHAVREKVETMEPELSRHLNEFIRVRETLQDQLDRLQSSVHHLNERANIRD